jgi:hypothetical protein
MSGKKKSRLSRIVQSLVPTYGNYCGPGWTQGERKDEYDFGRKVRPIDDLDAMCQQHDIDVARKGPARADRDFVNNLRTIDRDVLSPYGQLYAAAAEAVFENTPGSAWFNEEVVPEPKAQMTTVYTGPVAPMGAPGPQGPQGPTGTPGPGSNLVMLQAACIDTDTGPLLVTTSGWVLYPSNHYYTQVWKTPLVTTEFGVYDIAPYSYIYVQMPVDHVPVVLKFEVNFRFKIADWDTATSFAVYVWLRNFDNTWQTRLPVCAYFDINNVISTPYEANITNYYYYNPADSQWGGGTKKLLAAICVAVPPGDVGAQPLLEVLQLPLIQLPVGGGNTFTPSQFCMTVLDVQL